MIPSQATCYIGIGSNIDQEKNLKRVACLLREEFPKIIFSSVYSSKAMYVEDQEDFLNAVARIETEKKSEEIQLILQKIEKDLKKSPPVRRGPRTIDLDILLYDDLILKTEDLCIPHPLMHERRFVLEPLCEVIGIYTEHPVYRRTWNDLQKIVKKQQCTRADLVF